MRSSPTYLKYDEVDIVLDQDFSVLSDFPLDQCFILLLHKKKIIYQLESFLFCIFHQLSQEYQKDKIWAKLDDFVNTHATSWYVYALVWVMPPATRVPFSLATLEKKCACIAYKAWESHGPQKKLQVVHGPL